MEVMVQKLLHTAKKHRWWLIAPMVIGALAGSAATTVIPNQYESEATILVAHQQVPERYVTPNNTTDPTEALLLVTDAILSRTELLRIINEFDLYPKRRKHLAPEDLVEMMRLDITIAPMEKNPDEKDLNSFKISFKNTDPHVAQEVTSRLTTLFIQGDLKSRADVAQQTTAFFDEQLQAAAEDLSRQEAQVRDYKMRYLGELPEEQAGNLTILSGLQTQLQTTMDTITRGKEQQVYYESMISQYQSLAAAGVAAPGAVVANPNETIKEEIARLRSQRADLLSRYTAKYPDVVKIDEQIKANEALLAASTVPPKAPAAHDNSKTPAKPVEKNATIAQLTSQSEANRLEIQSATEKEKRLEAQIAEYQARLNSTPIREQQLADLLRNYDLSKKNYDDLLNKKQQSELATQLQERQQGTHFTLIDPASLPMKPASPIHLKIALGGLAAGLALGAGVLFLKQTIDHSLLTEKDLARYFSFPLLIGLPSLPTPAESRKQTRLEILQWIAATALCLLVCATEFYVYRRG